MNKHHRILLSTHKHGSMRKIIFLILFPLGAFCQEMAEQKHASNSAAKTSFNVMDFGAKGIGTKYDDTQAFQEAVRAAIAVHGQLIIPSPPSFYNITNTIEIIPSKGAQSYLTIEAWGHTAA